MAWFRRMKRVRSKVLGVDDSMGRILWKFDGGDGDVEVIRTTNGDTLLNGNIFGPLTVHFEEVDLDAADTLARFISESVRMAHQARRSKRPVDRTVNGKSHVPAG